MPKRLTQKEIIEALYKANGILAVAARYLGCERQTIYNRMRSEESQKIAKAYRDARETNIDMTENELIKNIKKGKESSIFYNLNNMGRDRGYGKPLLIAPTDPTGKKEYGAGIRDTLRSLLLQEATPEGEGTDPSKAD